MKHYLIFAGTTEGRKLTEFFLTQNVKLTVCTATEYGKILLPENEKLTVLSKRLDSTQMQELMATQKIDAVFDATHPYATVVTENIKNSTNALSLPYYRILRPKTEMEDLHSVVFFHTLEEAIDYLSAQEGNILSTIGSKELGKLRAIPDYENRVFARILSNPEMVQKSYEEGFRGKHLICMQGPFSEELNIAMIHQFDISFVLTKSSGSAGGFPEKVRSAQKTGSTLVVIGRPVKEDEGYLLQEIYQLFS